MRERDLVASMPASAPNMPSPHPDAGCSPRHRGVASPGRPVIVGSPTQGDTGDWACKATDSLRTQIAPRKFRLPGSDISAVERLTCLISLSDDDVIAEPLAQTGRTDGAVTAV